MSERRNLERMTKTGRGVIHTKWATDEFRDGWERTFRKRKSAKLAKKGVGNNAVREGQER